MKEKKLNLASKCAMIIIPMILLIFGVRFLGWDFVPFLKWWLAVFILGMIAFPLTASLFKSFNDKGYLFSKMIGIALVGYGVWFVSSIKVMKFTRMTSIIISVLLCFIIYGYYLVEGKIRNKKMQQSTLLVAKKNHIFECFDLSLLSKYYFEELFFFAMFLIFIYIKGFKPEASGTEKFMDYGFMAILNKSAYMPAEDLWFAGSSINYYYVGQFMATFLTKFSGVKISEGYNLMLMMIAAVCMVLPYSITLNLLLNVKDRNGKIRCKRVFAHIGGIISAFAVTFAGNMHYTYYNLLVPWITKFLSLDYTPNGYWFPDATRYIGYQPDTQDKTIHEFPNYSFVLGDLHAHVINLIFVLVVLGLLLAWQINKQEQVKRECTTKQLVLGAFQPSLILIGFFIGIFQMTNYWDYPIYYVVSGAIILFTNIAIYKDKINSIIATGIQGIYMYLFALIIALPFNLSFDQIATRILFAEDHSYLRQLFVLWGLPVIVITGYIIFRIHRYSKAKGDVDKRDWSHIDRFAILIGLCAMGLVLVPEVVYVEDIYTTYKRANTMFKLTYQAFLMMGILFGFIFVRLVAFHNTAREKKFSIICFLVFLTTLGYSVTATKSWFGNIFDHAGYKGIDCAAFLEESLPEDAAAIAWINENVSDGTVVLEANGDSYTNYERVSVFTGLPTVLGWRTHEWLWRGTTDMLDERAGLIEEVYTSSDESRIRYIIERFDIEYIYVGNLEKERFPMLNHSMLSQLGDIVFESNTSTDLATKTYIVKVNR